jgi:hypothetical protein
MKKPGKCCFLVKKKRPRGGTPAPEGLPAPKENKKSKEIFSIKTENVSETPLKEVGNRINKKNEGYKVLGCEDDKIILRKVHKENKVIRIPGETQEGQEKSIIKKKSNEWVEMEGILDYDKFLEELDKPEEDVEIQLIKENNLSRTQILVEAENKPPRENWGKKEKTKIAKIGKIDKSK